MQVGILGSGEVARALATGFLKHGHAVKFGTRTPSQLQDWVAAHAGAGVGGVADAAEFGEVIVLAVKGAVALQVLDAAKATNLAGKTVIDTTNPIADEPPINGVLRFFTDLDDSLLEQLQRAVPEARFVKAFNSVGSATMVDPDFGDVRPTMCICGNDRNAKATVGGFLDQFGWEPIDMGQAESARAIEPLCMLWCIPGFLRNEWSHAFHLLRRS